jgi:hypothetical protein
MIGYVTICMSNFSSRNSFSIFNRIVYVGGIIKKKCNLNLNLLLLEA